MPYTRINGSTFPAPDPAVVGQTPNVTDPDYATKIIQFTHDNAPDDFQGNAVNFFQTFSTTVTYDDAFPNGDGSDSLIPLFNLQIWGAPTSKPAADPSNNNFIYLRFQRGIMHYDKGCNCTQGLLLADYLKSVLTRQYQPATRHGTPAVAEQRLGLRLPGPVVELQQRRQASNRWHGAAGWIHLDQTSGRMDDHRGESRSIRLVGA
jgi:hypothetical protein